MRNWFMNILNRILAADIAQDDPARESRRADLVNQDRETSQERKVRNHQRRLAGRNSAR